MLPSPYKVCPSTMMGVSPDVDGRPARGVGLGLAQHLVRDRRDVPLPEQDVSGQELERVALGPVEVDVRALARLRWIIALGVNRVGPVI